MHRPSLTAAIVWASSHWNKYFCSHIFLEAQTELLSSAVCLCNDTKAALNCPHSQPMSSKQQWLSVHQRPAGASFLLDSRGCWGAKRIF